LTVPNPTPAKTLVLAVLALDEQGDHDFVRGFSLVEVRMMGTVAEMIVDTTRKSRDEERDPDRRLATDMTLVAWEGLARGLRSVTSDGSEGSEGSENETSFEAAHAEHTVTISEDYFGRLNHARKVNAEVADRLAAIAHDPLLSSDLRERVAACIHALQTSAALVAQAEAEEILPTHPSTLN
jgi:hypothetical protein